MVWAILPRPKLNITPALCEFKHYCLAIFKTKYEVKIPFSDMARNQYDSFNECIQKVNYKFSAKVSIG